MNHFKDEYQKRVIANAKAFAQASKTLVCRSWAIRAFVH
jgi:hypothetical protein